LRTRAMPRGRPQPVRNAPLDFLGDKCPSETKLRTLARELRTKRTTIEIVRAEYSERVAHGVAAIAVGGFKMAKEQDLLRQRVAAAGDSLSASRDALVKADREMQVLTEAFCIGLPAARRQQEMRDEHLRQLEARRQLARVPILFSQRTPTAAPAAIVPLAGLTTTLPASCTGLLPAVAGNSSRSRATPYGRTPSQASVER
jgi:hypothetical protein